MFCMKCGKEIENGVMFCKNCGEPVENTESNTQKKPVIVRYSKIGVIIAGLLLALSTVLPYVTFGKTLASSAGFKHITLLKAGNQIGDGILFIILAVIAIVFVCFRKKIPVLVCGVLSALMCWYEASQFANKYLEVKKGSGIDIWDYMSRGSGYYLQIISIILLLVCGVLYFCAEKKGSKK